MVAIRDKRYLFDSYQNPLRHAASHMFHCDASLLRTRCAYRLHMIWRDHFRAILHSLAPFDFNFREDRWSTGRVPEQDVSYTIKSLVTACKDEFKLMSNRDKRVFQRRMITWNRRLVSLSRRDWNLDRHVCDDLKITIIKSMVFKFDVTDI